MGADGKMNAVAVEAAAPTKGSFEAGAPVRLFETHICRMQLSRRLNKTGDEEKELKPPGAQARARHKAGTQATVSSHPCANA